MPEQKAAHVAETDVYAKLYATGDATVAADADPALANIVRIALISATRATASIDLYRFRELLRERGIAPDQVEAIAATAHIAEDEAYFVPRERRP